MTAGTLTQVTDAEETHPFRGHRPTPFLLGANEPLSLSIKEDAVRVVVRRDRRGGPVDLPPVNRWT